MKTLKFVNEGEWLAARRGKITGSRLKDIIVKRGTDYKIGYYELIAEKLSVLPDEEDPMERGKRLESEAVKRFEHATKKKVNTDLVIWTRDDNENIALSPDGFIGKTEAVEVKCLSSAQHIKAFLTKEIPPEYEMQAVQYFIVNDSLKTLYFVFYDPRVLVKDYFVIPIKREDVAGQVAEYLEYERKILPEIDEIVAKLTNF
ncbi:YqaJ viral recombinase family protein [Patescibacteria group bacterium]|nr:YqaJ viral recombinase family protein [Patescibacteria group bacterium]